MNSGGINSVSIGISSLQGGGGSSSETIAVVEEIIHPGYNSPYNDAMILRLERESTKDFIRVANDQPSAGQQFSVIGFGDTVKGDVTRFSTDLQEASVDYVSNPVCQQMIRTNYISPDMLCAIGDETDAW